MPTYDEIIKSLPAEALAKNGKYTAKLDFTTRCAALACLKAGVYRRFVAAAFGINRATLSYITRESSPHYRDVRREYRDLGHERFITKYMTPEVIGLIDRARKDPEVALSDDSLQEVKAAAANKPNKNAKKHMGRHMILYESGMLMIEMTWVTDPGDSPDGLFDDRPEGWYFSVSPMCSAYEPGGWKTGWWGDPDHCRTSKKQLDWLVNMVNGELQE